MLSDHRLGLPVPSPDDFDPPVDDLDLGHRRLVSLAHGLDGTTLSGERLGWVVLWTRAIATQALARSASDSAARMGIITASRTAIELFAHVRAIARPVMSENELKKKFGQRHSLSDGSLAAAIDRLRAYAAWTLASDRERAVHEMRSLGKLYDSRPAEELRRDPEAARVHEALFGSIPTESRQELSTLQASHKASLQEELDRLHSWARSPELEKWLSHPKLASLDAGVRATFFELLGDEETQLSRQLFSQDLHFVYNWYSRASAIMHGSTVNEFVIVASDGTILPRIVDADMTRHRSIVVEELNKVWLVLGILRGHVWGEDSGWGPSEPKGGPGGA